MFKYLPLKSHDCLNIITSFIILLFLYFQLKKKKKNVILCPFAVDYTDNILICMINNTHTHTHTHTVQQPLIMLT